MAQRFPDAEIVCVEPSAENFRMLALNTSAYPNIRRINAAVWSAATGLRFAPHSPGDWGTSLRDSPGPDGGEVMALSLFDILARAGWDRAEFLKCDIEGAELQVFSAAGGMIGPLVDCCAIELHELAAPGCGAAVAASFDDADFDHRRSGEYDVYARRIIGGDHPPPAIVHVLRPTAGLRQIGLGNVPAEAWGYYLFDGVSCQLNAMPHPGPAAELTTALDFSGQRAFDCEIMVENPLGHGVTFGVSIRDATGTRPILDARIDVAAGERRRWTLPTEELRGSLHVGLTTQMAAGTPTNHQNRAYWLDPRFR